MQFLRIRIWKRIVNYWCWENTELFRSASAYREKRLLTTTQPHDIIFKTVKKVGDRMSLKNVNHQKRSFTWSMEKPSAKDYFLTVFIFAVCTLIGLLFQKRILRIRIL